MMNPQLLLRNAREMHSQQFVADALNVSASTVRRWERGDDLPESFRPELIRIMRSNGGAKRERRAIDLFAGIGGIRLGFERHGYECRFTSEWDKHAVSTYTENFGNEAVFGDITAVHARAIPDHDVLLAGFPCQPFSLAGVSKKNALGRPHGFADETQGTLFFDVARIIEEKRPEAFLLENVKNLVSHDGGRTFEVIKRTLSKELGYEVHTKVVNGKHFTPQKRERILIVGFKEPSNFSWDDLRLPEPGPTLETILHRTDGSEPFLPWDGDRFFDFDKTEVPDKFTLSEKLWNYLQSYAAKHRAAGNGFGFGLVGPEDVSRTLSARYHKDGSEILIRQEGSRPRRLTPRECARLMGFPDEFRIPVSDTQAYRQFGNSVVVPVMQEVARMIDDSLTASSDRQSTREIAVAAA